MPKNRIQFQKGMSLPEFVQRFGAEEQCELALFEWHWPQGFRCPECGYGGACWLESRKVFQCHRCHRQSSLTSGTIFAATKLPLRVWFLAMLPAQPSEERDLGAGVVARARGLLQQRLA